MKFPVLHLGRILALTAVFTICGGHWIVMQGVAWSEMLATAMHEESFVAAVSQTFDGEHPCSICKSIQHDTEKQKRSETRASAAKLVFILVRAQDWFHPTASGDRLPIERCVGFVRKEAPSVPPPQSAV
jgi:hypothetical protein